MGREGGRGFERTQGWTRRRHACRGSRSSPSTRPRRLSSAPSRGGTTRPIGPPTKRRSSGRDDDVRFGGEIRTPAGRRRRPPRIVAPTRASRSRSSFVRERRASTCEPVAPDGRRVVSPSRRNIPIAAGVDGSRRPRRSRRRAATKSAARSTLTEGTDDDSHSPRHNLARGRARRDTAWARRRHPARVRSSEPSGAIASCRSSVAASLLGLAARAVHQP